MIVLVEDSDGTAALHRVIIHNVRPDRTVHRARSFDEFRGILALRPIISLVLMDIILIGKNGNDAIAYMRSIPVYRTTPIVVLSGSDLPEGRREALARGATEFFVKDYENYPELVENILRKYLK